MCVCVRVCECVCVCECVHILCVCLYLRMLTSGIVVAPMLSGLLVHFPPWRIMGLSN